MKKLKILLVDDDQDDRQFFADALTGLDMSTELYEVADGMACLQFLTNNMEHRPDLIFLDLNMPVMNGFQCLDRIREEESCKDVIVAIYSTSSSEKDIEETFKKGANIYITKPSSFKDLKKSLKQVIKTNWAYQTNDFRRENFLLKV